MVHWWLVHVSPSFLDRLLHVCGFSPGLRDLRGSLESKVCGWQVSRYVVFGERRWVDEALDKRGKSEV